jgi:hypothetical protein
MAGNNAGNSDTGGGSKPAPLAGAQPKITWDSSRMQSAYSNVFDISGSREGLVMLFGTNQGWDSRREELKVHLSDRIVLSPYAAKHFSRLLDRVIEDYEKIHGAIDIDERPKRR